MQIKTATSLVLVLMAVLMLFVSLLPRLFSLSLFYSYTSIVCINIYSIIILFSAAAKSDLKLEQGSGHEKFTNAVLPKKRSGLVIFSLLLAALIFGFASLYLGLPEGIKNGNSYLKSFYDFVYFSSITIATVGYGDFVPVSDPAKAIVIWELGSGILVAAGGFGLLISRLATYK